jgi:hypothetical protein
MVLVPVQRYLDNVVATDRKMIAKVFHVLKWTSRELEWTIEALLEMGSRLSTQGSDSLNAIALGRQTLLLDRAKQVWYDTFDT